MSMPSMHEAQENLITLTISSYELLDQSTENVETEITMALSAIEQTKLTSTDEKEKMCEATKIVNEKLKFIIELCTQLDASNFEREENIGELIEYIEFCLYEIASCLADGFQASFEQRAKEQSTVSEEQSPVSDAQMLRKAGFYSTKELPKPDFSAVLGAPIPDVDSVIYEFRCLSTKLSHQF